MGIEDLPKRNDHFSYTAPHVFDDEGELYEPNMQDNPELFGLPVPDANPSNTPEIQKAPGQGKGHLSPTDLMNALQKLQNNQTVGMHSSHSSSFGGNTPQGSPIGTPKGGVPGIDLFHALQNLQNQQQHQGGSYPSPYGSPRPYASPYGSPRPYPSPYGSPRSYASPYGSPRSYASPCGSPRSCASPCGSPRPYASPCGSPKPCASPCGSPRPYASPYGSPRSYASCISPQRYQSPRLSAPPSPMMQSTNAEPYGQYATPTNYPHPIEHWHQAQRYNQPAPQQQQQWPQSQRYGQPGQHPLQQWLRAQQRPQQRPQQMHRLQQWYDSQQNDSRRM